MDNFDLDSKMNQEIEKNAIEILKDKYKKKHGLTEEQFLVEVSCREFKNIKDFFIEAFSYEIVDEVYRNVEEQLRKDYIERLKFSQEYINQKESEENLKSR